MDFDFSGLPAAPTRGTPAIIPVLIDMLKQAPRPLTLAEVMQVLAANNVENVPAKTTVRKYLTSRSEFFSPTKITYTVCTDEEPEGDNGGPEDDAAEEAVTVEEIEEAVQKVLNEPQADEDEFDPLADL